MAEQRFTVGRDNSCDVPIADDSVSRLHAQVVFTDGDQIFLADCHSSNGTYVVRGGQPRRIQQEFVSPADTVQFGEAVVRVADLLAAIRSKHQKVRTDHLRAARPEPPAGPGIVKGQRLVRCACGGVKAKGEKCPLCGN